ncbi:MAG: helical backbone metal receptor [Planctomycetota bacterium]|jgi:ABC-type Fe3+-hydroxamate transport system substrate-binding protein
MITRTGSSAAASADGIAEWPRRIVSLVPSVTETLHELGLAERVVGRTRYCVHPKPWVDGLPAVGGTKDPDLGLVSGLSPDLIVVNHEENRPEQFPALAAVAPLHESTPRTVDEALADVSALAARTGVPERGDALVARIRARREHARASARTRPAFTYAYLIWRAPWMTVNADTYVSALLAEVGGVNVFAQRRERYPRLEAGALLAAEPDRILLASEPYPFRSEHVAEFGELAPCCRLVDGELLCWHGSRMEAAFPYLETLDRP